ncbi:MAG: tetraacyldisaccharide 4'-kinase [Planctomycetota bacterium]
MLLFLSLLYSIAMRIRNLLYDCSLFRSFSVNVPVVSIGNITVGGTGKTPLVQCLAKEALRRGYCCGVVARGYKGMIRDGTFLNDEGLHLSRSVPGLVMAQNPDRVAAAKSIIAEKNVNFILIDDGFQHRRLKRDLNIAVIDATLPFGYDRVLPAGLLREPLCGLNRADFLIISRCDQVKPQDLDVISARLQSLAPGVPVFKSAHTPQNLVKVSASEKRNPETLRSYKIFAFSGIANPAAFEETLLSLGAELTGSRTYPDHYEYRPDDIQAINEQAYNSGAEMIVTTSKDGGKLSSLEGAQDMWILDVALRLLDEESRFWNLIFPKDGYHSD